MSREGLSRQDPGVPATPPSTDPQTPDWSSSAFLTGGSENIFVLDRVLLQTESLKPTQRLSLRPTLELRAPQNTPAGSQCLEAQQNRGVFRAKAGKIYLGWVIDLNVKAKWIQLQGQQRKISSGPWGGEGFSKGSEDTNLRQNTDEPEFITIKKVNWQATDWERTSGHCVHNI